MKRGLVALLSGTLFGIGLALSGMMNPARVRGFLDIFGAWDPTLAFVMGGAVLVMAIAWRVQKAMHSPIVCEDFSLPGTKLIDVPSPDAKLTPDAIEHHPTVERHRDVTCGEHDRSTPRARRSGP